MFELQPSTTGEYLARRGWHWAPSARICALGGGVSNTVLLVEGDGGRFICKQALEKLRVEQDWRSRPERSVREARGLEIAARLLGAGHVPEVVFTDPENHIFAMTAAPATASDWKSMLLEGELDPAIAGKAGVLLGDWISGSWRNAELEAAFGDQTVFEELRLDPYYRFTAEKHPELSNVLLSLAERCRRNRYCLVHGDWSPKNLLVSDGAVIAIDFEVVHFGDPAFDAGFLINHLALKSIHLPHRAAAFEECALRFWRELQARLPADASWMWEASIGHLGGLMLARVDGKSPVEYLDAEGQERARRAAKTLLKAKPATMEEVWQLL